MLVNGSRLGGHVVAVRVGSHESSAPFSFVLDGDRPVQFRNDFETVFLSIPDLRFPPCARMSCFFLNCNVHVLVAFRVLSRPASPSLLVWLLGRSVHSVGHALYYRCALQWLSGEKGTRAVIGHCSTPKSLPQYVRCESGPVSVFFFFLIFRFFLFFKLFFLFF